MSWAGVAMAGAAAVGGTATAVNQHNAPDGGGGMNFSPTFPAGNAFLKYLFGGGKDLKRKIAKGADVGLFGPEARNAIGAYMNGTTFGPGGPNLLGTVLGSPTDFMGTLGSNLGYFDEAIKNMQQFNANGLPTDGTAYFNEAIRRLRNEAIPAAAETSGLGVQSSGFANASANASENLLGQAALANIDLAEAAANRRQQAASALATLAGARTALPLNVAGQLSDLFGSEQRRPLDVFTQLMGVGNQQQYGAPSYNPYDPTSGYLGAAGGISGILGALSNIKFPSSEQATTADLGAGGGATGQTNIWGTAF